jgi:hypothetical protein
MTENKPIIEASEEQLLSVYLNSRGINPKFVTKDTKISHAKSTEFAKWKVNHQNDRRFSEESEQIDELAPETLASYVLKTTSKDPKRAEPRKKAMGKLAKIMAKRSFSEAKTIQGTALDKFRQAAADRARKHDDIEREMKARHAAGKEDMKGSIDRLQAHLNKEATDTKDLISKLQKDLPKVNDPKNKDAKPANWTGPKKDDYGYTGYQGHGMPTDKQERQNSKKIKEESGVSKSTETKFHKKLDKLVHSTFGKRKDELKMKEETEQIDELKKSTVFSWLKQQPVVPEKKPGMSRKDHNKKIKSHSKSWNRALDRLAGYKPTSEETENVSEVFSTGVQGHVSQAALDSIKNKRNVKVNLGTPSYNPKPKTLAKKPSKKASFISRLLNKEDTYQDSYAATQTTGMEIVDLPADEKYNKRKEMSKSARMIKSLYKKKGMKEGIDGQSGGGIMYDKEKTDKLETPYGKKPSMVRADKKMTISDKEPQAAAVLTGGKTLTGQDRDTLEIDPLMRKPGPPLDQNKKT